MKSMLKMKMLPCRYTLFKDIFTIVLQVNGLPDTALIDNDDDDGYDHDERKLYKISIISL
jgi:hypothetical protein